MIRPPLRHDAVLADYEGQAIQRSVREVEARRRWRSTVIWTISLSICTSFGWMAGLSAILDHAGSFSRPRGNALIAFLAAAGFLLILARPHLGRPTRRGLQALGGILYLSALGGLILLGVWLAILGAIVGLGQTGFGGGPAAIGSEVAWLLSGAILLALGGAAAWLLLRWSPRPV